MDKNLKIIFFGSDEFVIPVLKALQDNFVVAAAVTAPESAVSKFFSGNILTPSKLDEDFSEEIKKLAPDLIVVASYGKIIPESILGIPKYGALNVHPSLLPQFRGASPVPATILAGEVETGVTIIQMDEKMDHGPIVSTSKITLIGQEDTPTLITKLFQLGAELIVESIPDFIDGKLTPVPQNHEKATFCKTMRKEDGQIDLENLPEAKIMDRMIRAYSPWPGVWTTWKDKVVKFLPGNMLQMEGKKPVPLKEFLNGYPDFPIKTLSAK